MEQSSDFMNEIHRKPNCPYGKKAVQLLKRERIAFEDHIFSSKDVETDFKEKHGVRTTPQIFIEGKRVGGYSDLAAVYGEVETPAPKTAKEKTYTPIIAVFSTTALLALASSTGIMGFMGFSLSVLALLKLMDMSSFIGGFKKYDKLAQAFPLYATAYPLLELFTGLGFISGGFPVLTGAVSTFVGIAGGISVVKAVYLDKKELSCACVGGGQNVPLGIISFIENAMMTIMGVYLLWL